MLTAARAEWIHHEKRPSVLDAGRVVLAVAYDHVRSCQITQRGEIGHDRRRVGVERHLLAMIRPEGIASDLHEHLIRQHLLDHAAGFHGLARVIEAGAAVLVAAEHSAGNLPIAFADLVERGIGGCQIGLVARLEIELRWLAEAFGDVDVMPVRQVTIHLPVGGAAVDFFPELQQSGIAGAVIKPVNGLEVVAAAHFLPVVCEHGIVRDC